MMGRGRARRANNVLKFDLATWRGRLLAYLDFLWNDHAYLRLGFRNAHWISDEMVRSNQPWPHQLAAWKAQGVRTVINLRGGFDSGFHLLEARACRNLGLELVNFTITSRDAPSAAQIAAARELFGSIAYPALLHCKSGADRAGMMSALYLHFRQKAPIEIAKTQLGLRYLHLRSSRTGVLDAAFDAYLAEGVTVGSFQTWTQSPAYRPDAIKAAHAARRRRLSLADRFLRRE